VAKRVKKRVWGGVFSVSRGEGVINSGKRPRFAHRKSTAQIGGEVTKHRRIHLHHGEGEEEFGPPKKCVGRRGGTDCSEEKRLGSREKPGRFVLFDWESQARQYSSLGKEVRRKESGFSASVEPKKRRGGNRGGEKTI